MLPTWIIEKIARERREREAREEQERARLWIEEPYRAPAQDRPETEPAGSSVIVIDIL
jgi:hypothetical protein